MSLTFSASLLCTTTYNMKIGFRASFFIFQSALRPASFSSWVRLARPTTNQPPPTHHLHLVQLPSPSHVFSGRLGTAVWGGFIIRHTAAIQRVLFLSHLSNGPVYLNIRPLTAGPSRPKAPPFHGLPPAPWPASCLLLAALQRLVMNSMQEPSTDYCAEAAVEVYWLQEAEISAYVSCQPATQRRVMAVLVYHDAGCFQSPELCGSALCKLRVEPLQPSCQDAHVHLSVCHIEASTS
ncbi:hypothetical protein CDEST_13873 [Colletotrichum destructivum]|uniref:Uncharacterized protein n=1 Tax=Colletotrichum destructivum TaxID=34406 RepID=A0AAX4IZY9_9PEZI|nr:hypothetical protein CDEST_13873 [Colletotrichum destructivum]